MSNLDLEDLIKNVKLYPALYDAFPSGYCTNAKKSAIWEQIGKRCRVTGDVAKEQWLKLRECHREALRRRTFKRGAYAPNIKLWKYEKQMEFLLPHMRHRKRPSTLSQIAREIELSQKQPVTQEENEDNPLEVTEQDEAQEMWNTVDSSQIFEENISSPLKKQRTEKNSFLDFLKEQAQRRDERLKETTRLLQNNITDENDPLKKFFESMFLSTKALDPSLQTFVKRKVFEAVCEAEDLVHNPGVMQCLNGLPKEDK
ncbi:hypothetical protein C0J52_15327 [Blattella germanica]|nr:hypothetical protein C0J52_15327 [Blattella germanica]